MWLFVFDVPSGRANDPNILAQFLFNVPGRLLCDDTFRCEMTELDG